jgi:hypothetical protein
MKNMTEIIKTVQDYTKKSISSTPIQKVPQKHYIITGITGGAISGACVGIIS